MYAIMLYDGATQSETCLGLFVSEEKVQTILQHEHIAHWMGRNATVLPNPNYMRFRKLVAVPGKKRRIGVWCSLLVQEV